MGRQRLMCLMWSQTPGGSTGLVLVPCDIAVFLCCVSCLHVLIDRFVLVVECKVLMASFLSPSVSELEKQHQTVKKAEEATRREVSKGKEVQLVDKEIAGKKIAQEKTSNDFILLVVFISQYS
eukprot:766957-Hanusia_phi.AAC.9